MENAKLRKELSPSEIYNCLFHYQPFISLINKYTLKPKQIERLRYLIAGQFAILDHFKETQEFYINFIHAFICNELKYIQMKPSKNNIEFGKKYFIRANQQRKEILNKLLDFKYYQFN